MPRWFDGLRVALRSVVRRNRVESELNEELQYHLDREIEERRQAGLAPDDARYAALRSMGAMAKSKEECRDVRSGNLVSEFLADLRYAARSFRRSPGFAALVIAIMALGIGANTAVFSVVNGVLLKPLPYPGADRIVTLTTRTMATGQINPAVTLANFRDWRAQSSSFDALATYRGGEAPITPGDTAEYARHANVDIAIFRVLGVTPLIGRTFNAEDAAPKPAQLTALISYGYWQTRYGGDPGVLQRTIRVGTGLRTILGVMPPGFQFPNGTDVWTPQPDTAAASRTSHSFFAVARLKTGVSVAQAQAELDTIAGRLEQEYPDSNQGRGVAARSLQDSLVGDVRLTLYLLWGVVGLVLLIACANTATLLLGKATMRTREIAVRTALGAGRRRIIRQLVTESLLLAFVAGVGGVSLAYWGTRAFVALTPADVVRLTDTGIDTGVLVFTVVVSIATSLLFGLVPALHASKVDLVDAVRLAGSRTALGGRLARTRRLLVVVEVALAVVLVTGAGLLAKSLVALGRVDLGFSPGNALVMKATGVRTFQENNAFFDALLPRIAALPGVAAVGATSIPPGDLSNSGSGAYFIDRVPEQRDREREPSALYTIVTPGAFAAMGIPITRGRDFDQGDTEDRPLVAIVNEALVRRSIPAGEDPIGRTLICSWDKKGPMTIVGVVGDARQRNPALEPMPDCVMPYRQHAYNNSTLNVVVRTAGDPMALAPVIRRAAADLAPDVPVSFTTMHALVAKRTEDPRFRTLLFSLFAALALGLAVAGVYGVMAHAVEQRSSEIGLRMALGATQGSVLRLILGQGLALAAAGLVLGLATAVAAARLLTTMLFDVQPIDLQVYIGVAVLLGLVTVAAGYPPARRAATTDPVQVLRGD